MGETKGGLEVNCVVCDKELGDDPFEQDGAKFRLHKECVTGELKIKINELLKNLGVFTAIIFRGNNDNKLIFSYVHKEKKSSEYPRCEQIGVTIIQEPVAHIKRANLHECLLNDGLDLEQYSELYGVQTQYIDGPYPWDVEAVLERMMSGKLTGTQLLMD